jgi:hypothetical protein
MDEPARQEPRHNVGKSGPVDPGSINEIGLGQPLLFGDGHEYGELPRGEAARAGLSLKNVSSALTGAMNEMRRRTFQLMRVFCSHYDAPLISPRGRGNHLARYPNRAFLDNFKRLLGIVDKRQVGHAPPDFP